MTVEDFIDLHVHIGPEVLPRRFTVPGIVRVERGRIAGLGLKNHFYPTTALIESAGPPDDVRLIGSVTLNRYVGGLNPDAVYGAAVIADLPTIVWFPTIHAAADLAHKEYEIPPEWLDFAGVADEHDDVSDLDWVRPADEIDGIEVTDGRGRLTDDARAVLEAIAANDCILATGHLSWEESRDLVAAAVEVGIERIVLTHPIWPPIDMPVEVQAELVRHDGVYAEHNYAMYHIDDIHVGRIADQIAHVGAENCVLASDMGQFTSPAPSDAMADFARRLEREGIERDDVVRMGATNPRRLLDLA